MIELPEAKVLSDQMNEVLIGKTVVDVIVGQSPHKFAWLSWDTDYEYYKIAKSKPTPFEEGFTYEYFLSVIGTKELSNKSAKEVLATKQRIPGLGNGVLQDILFEAGIHPKRKMSTLSEDEIRKRIFMGILAVIRPRSERRP